MVKIIDPSFEIVPFDSVGMLKRIEEAGRTCYQSSHKIDDTSYLKFVKMIIENGHESVLEHQSISVRFIVDRGFTHELVRHRLVAYSQESTRYCNYGNDKYGSEITVVELPKGSFNPVTYSEWLKSMKQAEIQYMKLINAGVSPQIARSVLPNSLKTDIVATTNLREWRHIFRLRTSPKAHPQMRQIMIPLLKEFQQRIPIVFDDIPPKE